MQNVSIKKYNIIGFLTSSVSACILLSDTTQNINTKKRNNKVK
jgi:hypothetical protein